MKQYAYIGSWGRPSPDNPLGIHLFEYEDGKFTHIEDYRPDIRVGCLSVEGDKVYSTDEGKDYAGAPNGGGRFLSFDMLEGGKLKETACVPSLGVFPCYIGFSIDKKYAVLANHSTFKNPIICTELVDGEYRVVTRRCESNVVLFRLNEDGSIGKAVDVVNLLTIEGDYKHGSLPHFLKRLPDKDIFLVVENGADRIYRFELDEDNEKLILMENSYVAPEDSNPRYFKFSNDMNYMYLVDEKRAYVNVLKVNPENGELKLISEQRMVPEDRPILQPNVGAPVPVSPSDLALSADGKYLYTACRGTDTITVFEIEEGYKLNQIQIVHCGGHNPRAISLDNKDEYLVVCNMDGHLVYVLKRNADGTLSETDKSFELNCPGFIRFFEK